MTDQDAAQPFDAVSATQAAAKGDRPAWESIVARYSNLVWSVARAHRLSTSDAADVYQATWLRLVENLSAVRDPERLGAWLGTTARREALAVIRRRDRNVPIGEMTLLDRVASDAAPPDAATGVDADLLRAEERGALWSAFTVLSSSCQSLLRVLFSDPPPSYVEVSEALDVPIGSIGPTRARCLANLRSVLSRTYPR